MFNYINTRDELGLQATFDRLINGSLTSFVDDSLTNLRQYAFYQNDSLASLILPNLTQTISTNIWHCKHLHTLALKNKSNGNNSYFDTVLPQLTHCILLDNSISPYIPINSTPGSGGNPPPLAFNIGAFYVPSELVNDYKNATNWSVCANMIHSIDEYDSEVIYFNDTITDSWAQIETNEINGTYNTKYHIGDTKTFKSNGQYYKMKIIAFDTDILSDNSGHAKITWLTQFGEGGTYAPLNNGSANYLSNIFNYIEDADLAAMIQTVKKPTMVYPRDGSGYTEQIQNLDIWLLSAQELNCSGYETSGITYSIFTDNNSRKFQANYFKPSSYSYYGTRSQRSDGYHPRITDTGELGAFYVDGWYTTVLFGFCT